MKNCIICNSNEAKKILNWKEYSIHKCNHCQLIFTAPLPSDDTLLDFYQGFLFNKPDKIEIRKQIEKRKIELKKLFSLKSDSHHKNFLDYGGGTGNAYQAACELDLKVYYHDLDEEAKAFVKEQHGLTKEFIINNINNSSIRFDYIFSDNVIEHLKNPIEYIQEMRGTLNDQGEILIKTPNGRNTESLLIPLITIKGYFLKSLKYNSLKDAIKSYFIRFWHCDPPRHLFAFSKKNLKIIALNAGFTENEIEISYYHIPFLEYSLTKVFFSFRKYNSIRTYLLRILILPIVPLEFMSLVLQRILLKLKMLSPAGIILRLRKSVHPE
jgi:2-polyprenyl-3-methyl-5-hydroxy-6-metoxy-1,4-benzoquinol methylase